MKELYKARLAPQARRGFFARLLITVTILLLSLLLLSYCFYFLRDFLVHKAVTSYFPWRFGVHYTSSGSVMNLFEVGLGISVLFLLTSFVVTIYMFRSLTKDRYDSLSVRKSGKEASIGKEMRKSTNKVWETSQKEVLRTKQRKNGDGVLPALHSRFGSKSRVAAVILLLCCIVLLIISYNYRNIVVELDSIIAFVAGLILLFKDQKHTIQLRIMNNALESSHAFMESAGIREMIGNGSYKYVPAGKTISDVILKRLGEFSTDAKQDILGAVQLTPIGRGLAQLLVREMPVESPTVDDLLESLPSILTDKLNLAAGAKVFRGPDNLEFLLSQPTLMEECSNSASDDFRSLYCQTCSMVATAVCHVSRREITIEGCDRNEELDTSTIRIRLGEKYEVPEESEQTRDVESNNT